MASGEWLTTVASGEGQATVASGEWAGAGGRKLQEFMAYRKSLELFDAVVEDMDKWMNAHCVERLVSQQIASADSVCSNVEEGYGRESSVEYRRFLIIARGSLRETRGPYRRMRHWIPTETVKQRMAFADVINRMLTATINKLNGRKKG